VYSTRVGGRGSDEAYGIALDAEGNAYVTGLTQSSDFPTVSAFASTLAGVQDAFVAKVSDSPPSADLTVTSLSVTGSGTNVTVTDTTEHEGNFSLGATTTKFYLSSDTTLDAGDVLLGSRAVGALEGGAASSGSTTLPIPAAPAAGAYFIIAQADAEGVIGEREEGNNTASRPFTLRSHRLRSRAQGGPGPPLPSWTRRAIRHTTWWPREVYLSADVGR
jgi:hypothetical protein